MTKPKHTPWMPNRLVLNERTAEMEPRIFQGLDGDCEYSFSRVTWNTKALADAIIASDAIIFRLIDTSRRGNI